MEPNNIEGPDWPLTGIIAQRTKNRVNKIGLSRAEIISVNGLAIKVKGLDAIDNTSIIDIKPYMREFAPDAKSAKQPAWASELMRQYF